MQTAKIYKEVDQSGNVLISKQFKNGNTQEDNSVIVKLNQKSEFQTELIPIKSVRGLLTLKDFMKLVSKVDNKVNPRVAQENKITKSIRETLKTSPELFFLKTKGILISTQDYTELDRDRVRLSFDPNYDGIMDGGHNTLAICQFVIEEIYDRPEKKEKIKTWLDCKNFIDAHISEILDSNILEDLRQIHIPIEILTPVNDSGRAEYENLMPEICQGRNNNVQLNAASVGNQKGYYDILKESLPDNFKVAWKSGERGFKVEDIVALACLPIIYLIDSGEFPDILRDDNGKEKFKLNIKSLYSQKGSCVDFYHTIMEFALTYPRLKEAIDESIKALLYDIIEFYDLLYVAFPDIYNKRGRFGGLNTVSTNKANRLTKFERFNSVYVYPDGFIYPLLTGVVKFMKFDPHTNRLCWLVNPVTLLQEEMNTDFNGIDYDDIMEFYEIIKLQNNDPQKIGKGQASYTTAHRLLSNLVKTTLA